MGREGVIFFSFFPFFLLSPLDQYSPTMAVVIIIFLMWDTTTLPQLLCSRIKKKKSLRNNFFTSLLWLLLFIFVYVLPDRLHEQLFFFVKKREKKNPGSNKVSSRRLNIVFQHFSFVRSEIKTARRKKNNTRFYLWYLFSAIIVTIMTEKFSWRCKI